MYGVCTFFYVTLYVTAGIARTYKLYSPSSLHFHSYTHLLSYMWTFDCLTSEVDRFC